MPMQLPEPLIPNAGNQLSAYRDGYAIGKDQMQTSTMQEAGGLAASGNMRGGANALMRGGLMAEGQAMLAKIQENARTAKADSLKEASRKVDIIAQVAAASNDKNWANNMSKLKEMGFDTDKFADPATRDIAIGLSSEAQGILKLEIEKRKAEDGGESPADLKTYKFDMNQRKATGGAPISFMDWTEERAASKRPAASATEMKAINEAEDSIPALQGTVDSLNRALELNPKTYSGFGAGTRGSVGSSGIPGTGALMGGHDAALATNEWQKIMNPEAITTMSSTLKGATTNFELGEFKDQLADPSTPPATRERIIKRMLKLAERQKNVSETRLNQMRDKSYYQPGGGASKAGGAPAGGPARLKYNPATGDFD